MSKTDTHTIRVDDRLWVIANLMIKRHPKTLSHSWFYLEGVLKAIETLTKNGENLPDNPYPEMVQITDEDIAQLQAHRERLTKLDKEFQESSSRTIMGRAAPIKKMSDNFGDNVKKRPMPGGGFQIIED